MDEITTIVQIVTHVRAGKRPVISPESQERCPAMVKLVQSCWAQDPAARPPFTKIVECLKQNDCAF